MTADEKAIRDQQLIFDMLYVKAIDALREQAERVYLSVREDRFALARDQAQAIATAAKILADALVKARG